VEREPEILMATNGGEETVVLLIRLAFKFRQGAEGSHSASQSPAGITVTGIAVGPGSSTTGSRSGRFGINAK
jgi:hypothetical protein